ncbi:hypothetical protein HaLaN_10436 [Haematococcus lacustris]|uniref:Uncharacterized protein n=1 Tax=Haematococcus lacustris TaxID=44745 RepID=A0A699ZFN2_HAELA|nr:hypothetical protein HaLaN_10436 [Haematococcus lacustris]
MPGWEAWAVSEHSALAQHSHTIVCFHGKPKLLEKATVRLNAHRVMAKDKRKSTTKHNKDPGKKQKGVSLCSRQATTGASGWLGNEQTSGHQGPGGRCAARVQEDEAQATGAPPATG